MRRIESLAIALAIGVLAGCGDGAARAEPVGPSLSVAPTAVLGGPSYVQANSLCRWYGGVTGGQAPYTFTWTELHHVGSYQWYGSGWAESVSGTHQWYYAQTSEPMTLTLTVTDAWGRTSTATREVDATWNAPDC
ncbi:MAG TPA: hypothetical protein VF615_27185, partial [Longimicrobiaceae bacterium]